MHGLLQLYTHYHGGVRCNPYTYYELLINFNKLKLPLLSKIIFAYDNIDF